MKWERLSDISDDQAIHDDSLPDMAWAGERVMLMHDRFERIKNNYDGMLHFAVELLVFQKIKFACLT